MQIVYAPEDYPAAAVQRLRVAGAEGNLALPLEWGGYALWHLAPRIKVSLDGRFATVYPHHIVEENFDYARRLVLAGVPTELVVVPGAFHAFDFVAPEARVSREFTQAWKAALKTAFAAST